MAAARSRLAQDASEAVAKIVAEAPSLSDQQIGILRSAFGPKTANAAPEDGAAMATDPTGTRPTKSEDGRGS